MAESTPSESARSPPKSPTNSTNQELTGDLAKDVKLAVKRINLAEDFSNIGQMPCARTSLLSGIASGVGIGFMRGINARPWVAFNWAMGSFVFVTIGTWEICRRRMRSEHQRIQVLVDSLPRVRLKRPEELED
ncbi:hypothetical protein JB92DRAFT_2901168 [Gautieria morchelliformis]|nr:hypothetical protein JB92DRAFT_2901168 [Gautieria morchelliformis]